MFRVMLALSNKQKLILTFMRCYILLHMLIHFLSSSTDSNSIKGQTFFHYVQNNFVSSTIRSTNLIKADGVTVTSCNCFHCWLTFYHLLRLKG